MDRISDSGGVAVVTGAASGIGRAVALVLAEAGMPVVLVDRDAEGGASVRAEVLQRGGSAVFAKADVSDGGQVRDVIESASAGNGAACPIAILVNAAGVLHEGLEGLRDEEVDASIDVNIKSALHSCRAAIPLMREAGSGVIVNIASTGASTCPPEWPVYVAGKAGIVGLTRSLAARLRSDGVAVFALSPGMVATPMGARAFADYYGRPPREEELARVLDPETVARVVLSLTRPEMRYASGSVIEVDVLGVEPLPESGAELELAAEGGA